MKLNKDTILKNLSIIICGVIIIGLFFPFVGVSASASAGGSSFEFPSEFSDTVSVSVSSITVDRTSGPSGSVAAAVSTAENSMMKITASEISPFPFHFRFILNLPLFIDLSHFTRPP